MVQVQLPKSTVVKVHAVYLQLNGDIASLENSEKKNVLFGDLPAAQVEPLHDDSAQHEAHQDELDTTAVPSPSNASSQAGP